MSTHAAACSLHVGSFSGKTINATESAGLVRLSNPTAPQVKLCAPAASTSFPIPVPIFPGFIDTQQIAKLQVFSPIFADINWTATHCVRHWSTIMSKI